MRQIAMLNDNFFGCYLACSEDLDSDFVPFCPATPPAPLSYSRPHRAVNLNREIGECPTEPLLDREQK